MEIWLNYKSEYITKNLSGNMTGGNGNMAQGKVHKKKKTTNVIFA